MKKTLSLLLVTVMLATVCLSALVFVSAQESSLAFDWATAYDWHSVDSESGIWQSSAQDNISYAYAAALTDDALTVGVKLDATLSGTAASYGNGAGTLLRVWLYNPDATAPASSADATVVPCTFYTHFFDIAYRDGAFVSRLLKNAYANANGAVLVDGYGFDNDKTDYTVNYVITETGADIELVVSRELLTQLGYGDDVQLIYSVSNLVDAGNAALYSTSLAYAVWTNPSNVFPYVPLTWADHAVWTDVDGETGTWQNGVEGADIAYSYATDMDEDLVKIGLKLQTELTGTAASYGNGLGTNVRVWFFNPEMEKPGYTHLIDVSYRDGAFVTFAKSVDGSWTVNYDTEAPYEVNYTLTAGGAEIELLVPKTLLGVTDSLEIIYSVSNKTEAYANDVLYSNTNVKAYMAWGDPSVIFPSIVWSDVDVSDTEETNIAVGKGWTGDTDKNHPSYAGDLTDGVLGAATLKYDGTDPWFGWQASRLTDSNGVATAVIDLGEAVENISSVGAHVWTANTGNGIIPPAKIVFSASLDGKTYVQVGEVDSFSALNPDWAKVSFEKYLTARYIKFEFTCTGTFNFVSELAVNTNEAEGRPASAIDIDNVGYNHGGTISLVAGGEQTVGEITARGQGTNGVQKDMNYAYVIVVDSNGRVSATYCDGLGAGYGKTDVVCPAGGYMISYNGNRADKTGFADMANIKIGATITLYGVSKADLAFARTQTGIINLEDAYFTYDNSTAYPCITVSHVNAYTWGVYKEMVIYGEGKNSASIGYECKYWIALKVENVNGTYTVTAIEGNGEDKVMTAPADGFLLYCFSNDAESYAAAKEVQVGDVMLEATFDWTKNAAVDTSVNPPLGTMTFVSPEEISSNTVSGIGDADGDGEYTAADVTALLQYLAGVSELPEGITEANLDVDASGKVDVYDTVLMLQYNAGLICEFPGQ